LIPIPVSYTEIFINYLSFYMRMLAEILIYPWKVNFIAFATKFIRIYFNLRGSLKKLSGK